MTHKRTHTGLKAFRCDICGLGFSRKTILDSHMVSHDDPSIAKDRGTVERTPVKMEALDTEQLKIMENTDEHINNAVPAGSGSEMEVEELPVQEVVPLQEEIHVQEETCVTIV